MDVNTEKKIFEDPDIHYEFILYMLEKETEFKKPIIFDQGHWYVRNEEENDILCASLNDAIYESTRTQTTHLK